MNRISCICGCKKELHMHGIEFLERCGKNFGDTDTFCANCNCTAFKRNNLEYLEQKYDEKY